MNIIIHGWYNIDNINMLCLNIIYENIKYNEYRTQILNNCFLISQNFSVASFFYELKCYKTDDIQMYNNIYNNI